MGEKSTSQSGRQSDGDQYEIRQFEPSDREDVQGLYRRIWEIEASDEWFEWQFEENPYRRGPPMVVADAGGTVVGARPFNVLPTRVDSKTFRSAYLSHLMVHPDHRRRGLFTRMTERAGEVFGDGEVAFLFAFANEQSAPGYRQFGWESVGSGPEKIFRVQRPGEFVEGLTDTPLDRVARPVVAALGRGYLRVRDARRASPSTERWTVERRSGLLADRLASLYERNVPEGLHVRREPRLYRWIDSNPQWDYETYLASRGGEPVAAIAVRRRSGELDPDPQIVDAVPLVTPNREAAFSALLQAVVAGHPNASVLSVTGPVLKERLFSEELLSAFGFVSTTTPPLSWIASRDDTLVVRPVGDGDRIVRDEGLTRPKNWLVRIR